MSRELLKAGIGVYREFVDKNGKVFADEIFDDGDELWVRLIILVPAITHHDAIVDDKLPAGIEAVNESFAITSLLNVEGLKVPEDRTPLYFRHHEIWDDRVVLFAETLPQGVHEYIYRIRPTIPGIYHHPGTGLQHVYSRYFGTFNGGWMEVKD